MCSCNIFGSPGKLMCSFKRIMSSPGKFDVFLLRPSLLENLMCSRNLFKKVAPGKKKNRYFSKIARRLLLCFCKTHYKNFYYKNINISNLFIALLFFECNLRSTWQIFCKIVSSDAFAIC